MTTAPEAYRQIGQHKWNAGLDNIISNYILKDQVVCWVETGWVYSMHVLEFDMTEEKYLIKVRQDTYLLDEYPPYVGNILEYIMDDDSNRFKKVSEIHNYQIVRN